MKFDFDPNKSLSNEKKHGINFEDAQELWDDPDAIRSVPDNYRDGEQYWLAVGVAKEALWTMIYNIRGNVLWIVSVRKARDYERQEYEILKN